MLLELLGLAVIVGTVGFVLWQLVHKIIPTISFAILGGMVALAILALSFLEPGKSEVAPAISFLTLFFLGTFLFYGYRDKVKARILMIVLSILLFFGIPVVADWLTAQQEQPAMRFAADDRPQAGPIVLLGNGATLPFRRPRPANQPAEVARIQLSPTGDRVIYVAQLYHELPDRDILILAGNYPNLKEKVQNPAPNAEKEKSVSEADDIREVLIALDVPADRLISETDFKKRMIQEGVAEKEVREIGDRGDLSDMAKRLKQYLDPKNKSEPRIVLVTTAKDISRAVDVFQSQGISVVPRPTSFSSAIADPDRQFQIDTPKKLPYFIPNPNALSRSFQAIINLLQTLQYRIRSLVP